MKEGWKKAIRKTKFVLTIVIISGVIIHLILVYNAARALEITGKKITGISPSYEKMNEYEITFLLTLKNPKSTSIEVDYIHYEVYVEDEFVGEGDKPRFRIGHGVSNHTFSLTFNAINLTPSVKNLLLYGKVNLTIKGEVIIPAKFMGLFTWRYVKLPYTIHDRLTVSF